MARTKVEGQQEKAEGQALFGAGESAAASVTQTREPTVSGADQPTPAAAPAPEPDEKEAEWLPPAAAAERDLADLSPTRRLSPDLEAAQIGLWLSGEYNLHPAQVERLIVAWAARQDPPLPKALIKAGADMARRDPSGTREALHRVAGTAGPVLSPLLVVPSVPEWWPEPSRTKAAKLARQRSGVTEAYAKLGDASRAFHITVTERKEPGKGIRELANGVTDAHIAALQTELNYVTDALAFCVQRQTVALQLADEKSESARILRAEIEEKLRTTGAGQRYTAGGVSEAPSVIETEARALQARGLAQDGHPHAVALQERLGQAIEEFRLYTEKLAGIF